MSTFSVNNFGTQWGSTGDFLAHSSASFDIPEIDWSALNLTQNDEAYFQDGMDVIDPSLQQNEIESPVGSHVLLSQTNTKDADAPKAKLTRTRRFKGVSEPSGQSAAEVRLPEFSDIVRLNFLQRRRAQVRVAQRAYRNREKATITTLRSDVIVLQKQLDEMKNIADNLSKLTSQLPNLPQEVRSNIQRRQMSSKKATSK
ncbi:hypothetical protein BT63DRAFT_419463 [Microthyrium microscopicum]|uniref:BZIP domain-containing protein n=1 Tax=Microthyrium microscopicum TaxID=703497 RepID=A0A6A6URQ6_9PEZI|nr:hypothetical protein BT63DRAFT_419463 [Microthyrium microscopicum]